MTTYKDYLLEVGRPEDADRPCLCRCGRTQLPEEMQDARAYPQIEGSFRCETCMSDIRRWEQYETEQAHAEANWPTDEDMAGLRAVRDQKLRDSDWALTEENIERKSMHLPEEERPAFEAAWKAKWKAYRLAIHEVVDRARDQQEKLDWPDLPT